MDVSGQFWRRLPFVCWVWALTSASPWIQRHLRRLLGSNGSIRHVSGVPRNKKSRNVWGFKIWILRAWNRRSFHFRALQSICWCFCCGVWGVVVLGMLVVVIPSWLASFSWAEDCGRQTGCAQWGTVFLFTDLSSLFQGYLHIGIESYLQEDQNDTRYFCFQKSGSEKSFLCVREN